MAKNIKFSYFYRDGSNYKNHCFLIFANPNEVKLADFIAIIQAKLIDNTWFYAEKWGLPDLKDQPFECDADPTWHEFENAEYTEQESNCTIKIEELIEAILKA